MKHGWFAVGCVALGLTACAAETPRANVVVMIADDLGYGDVSCLSNGKVKTPNLDRLAKSGVTFTAGYVTAPLCAPSRAGFFTGRYQQRFAFLNNDGGIPADAPLLPGALRAAGYRTALMGKWHSAGPMPYERGCFDETLTAPKSGPWVDYFDPALARNGVFEKRKGYISDILAQEAEAFIERNRQGPFSLIVTFNAPHIGPIKMPHDKVLAAYEAARAAGQVYDAPKTPTARPGEAARYAGQFPGDTARADTAATIAALDEAVGRILDKLQQAGVAERTAVFLFADNGGHPENRSENGALRDYKWSHYEGGIRVPFLASCPGVFPAGLVYDKPVSTLDIFPTVMALAGVKPPDGLDGVNLTPYLKGESAGSPHESLLFLTGDKGAVVQGRWKLVVFPRAAGQLYDLAKDLGETNDLAAAEAPRAQAMAAQWMVWKAQMPPAAPKKGRVEK
jgi:arylsulfatase A-like enzyme